MGCIEDFKRLKVEGVVIIHSALAPDEVEQMLGGIPAVLVDPQRPSSFHSVSLDRYRAMQMLLGHLLTLGHRRFGLLGISENDGWRWQPLVDRAREAGLDPATCFVSLPYPKGSDNSIRQGATFAEAILAEAKRPTALICIDDLVALGVVQKLREQGFAVPEDFSVTGFDHDEVVRHLQPSLTTIDQQPETLMGTSGQMLLAQIKNHQQDKTEPDSVLIPPQLIIGNSTASPRPA